MDPFFVLGVSAWTGYISAAAGVLAIGVWMVRQARAYRQAKAAKNAK